MKGGVDKNHILSEARFARTRENMSEFSNCATSGKFLRKAAVALTLTSKDGTAVSRLTKQMAAIKNLDATSPPGERSVEVGIQTPEGLAKPNSFNFNERAPIYQVLKAPYAVDQATGEIEIDQLQTAKNLEAPSDAIHVSLMSAFLNIDFASVDFNSTESPITNLPINLTPSTVTLTPAAVTSDRGVSLFLLGTSFSKK